LDRRFCFSLLLILFLAACNYPQPDSPEPCGRKRVVRALLSESNMADWAGWIADLSGARPVLIDGQSQTISSRFSYAMFSNQPQAYAFEYVLSLLNTWLEPQQIEVVPYTYRDAERAYTWKNLVVTFPGVKNPQETVYLSAHLDSIISHDGNPMLIAPGADDNASGDASLLEAIRLLRHYQFNRTIKVVFFTGEEQFQAGSRQFVASYPLNNPIGDINLDMFAYQSGNDRIIQLHTGTNPASQEISNCLIKTVLAYKLNVIPLTLTDTASKRSDHASFWQKNIPAIWVFDGFKEDALTPKDPYYHRPSDTFPSLNIDFGFTTSQAALATTASLAETVRPCFKQSLEVELIKAPGKVSLHWNALPGAVTYRILRSETDCNTGWSVVAHVNTTGWQDPNTSTGKTYHYRVEAVADSSAGYCVSSEAACLSAAP
jgi:Zn-dependent M28 family amino/carboxypeptidase